MEYFVPLLIVFCLTCCSIKLLNPLAVRIGLVDAPSERKIHVGSIPLVGGVSIYISVLVVSSVVFPDSQVFNLYLISAAMILFLGVLDDKYDLSVRLRLACQTITASILIFGAGLYLNTFGEILYFFEFKLGYVGILVTVLAVIGAINSFNMVDGIDGLAGMLSLVAFASLSLMFYLADSNWFMLPLLFIGAIIGYLLFNLRWPFQSLEKVFMGDAGSMLIGLTIVWLLVIGTQSNGTFVSGGPAFSPVTALYIIAVPLMDMAAIMYRRVKKGMSPFKPDRDHLHHIFERAGFNRIQTLLIISLISLLLAAIGVTADLANIPESLMFITFLIIFVFYNWLLSNVWRLLTKFRKA